MFCGGCEEGFLLFFRIVWWVWGGFEGLWCSFDLVLVCVFLWLRFLWFVYVFFCCVLGLLLVVIDWLCCCWGCSWFDVLFDEVGVLVVDFLWVVGGVVGYRLGGSCFWEVIGLVYWVAWILFGEFFFVFVGFLLFCGFIFWFG